MVDDEIEEFFQRFLARLEAEKIVSRSWLALRLRLKGCSPSEVAALEARYSVRLPRSYRRYLELMGHRCGRLFNHDHAAVSYDDALTMTAEERHHWSERPADQRVVIPPDMLIIHGRLGDHFLLIHCRGAADSPVYFYNHYDREIGPAFKSVMEWLTANADEARGAIASGYYVDQPGGTTP